MCAAIASIAFSDRARSASSSSTLRVLLTDILLVILLARVPNLRVERVSDALKDEGEQAIMRTVFELPLEK